MPTGNITSNGSTVVMSDAYEVKVAVAHGTFGGGTLSLEISADEANWVPTGVDGSMSEDGSFEFTNKQGMSYRLTLAGATSPNITWWII